MMSVYRLECCCLICWGEHSKMTRLPGFFQKPFAGVGKLYHSFAYKILVKATGTAWIESWLVGAIAVGWCSMWLCHLILVQQLDVVVHFVDVMLQLWSAVSWTRWRHSKAMITQEVKSFISFVKVYRRPYLHHRTSNSCSITLIVWKQSLDTRSWDLWSWKLERVKGSSTPNPRTNKYLNFNYVNYLAYISAI